MIIIIQNQYLKITNTYCTNECPLERLVKLSAVQDSAELHFFVSVWQEKKNVFVFYGNRSKVTRTYIGGV